MMAKGRAATATVVGLTGVVVHVLLAGGGPTEEEEAPVEVLLLSETPPISSWVEGWLGLYVQRSERSGRPVLDSEGGETSERSVRPVFNSEDGERVLWHAAQSGYWHVGHPHDVEVGAAMIAAHDGAASPELVSSPWRSVASAGRWVSEPTLRCVAVPPRTLWLSGHAPARWVSRWLGEYERIDEQESYINGRPSYRPRRCGARSTCAQRLWFTVSHGEAAWVLGDVADSSTSSYVLALRGSLPHRAAAPWMVADGAGGWVAVPTLRCTSSQSETIGWLRSRLDELWPPPAAARSPDVALHDALGGASWGGALRSSLCALAAALDAMSDGGKWLQERAADASPGLEAIWLAIWLDERTISLHEMMRASAQRVAADVAARVRETDAAFAQLSAYEAAVFTSLAWTLALVAAVLAGRWRRERRLAMLEDAEGELEVEEASESSEEKRLAFACLSGAIEEVKGAVNEQQYLALYSAAVWCFNLTPYWATSVPRPPSPPPEMHSEQGALRLRSEAATSHVARLALVVTTPACRLTLLVVPAHLGRGASVGGGGGGARVRVAAVVSALPTRGPTIRATVRVRELCDSHKQVC